jgi:hypothetical protein
MARRVTDEQLLRWLDDDPERLESYIDKYPAEADRIDQLTTLGQPLHDGLQQLVAPPADLPERMHAWFTTDPVVRETAEMLFDLMGLAWRTGRVLFTDTTGDEHP